MKKMKSKSGLDAMRPKDLREALNEVRVWLAGRRNDSHCELRDLVGLENMLNERYGIAPLEQCTGEAHSNPYVDHCGLCAPRWGWAERKKSQ